MNVWLVHLSYGSYEKASEKLIGCFDNQAKAELKHEQTNQIIKDLKKLSGQGREAYLDHLQDQELYFLLYESLGQVFCSVSDPIEVR